MQWDRTQYAGFSPTEPWLPLADTARKDNAGSARDDPTSIYQLHRRLIALRRSRPALLSGSYLPILAQGHLLLFGRQSEGDHLLVALNLGHQPEVADLGDDSFAGRLLLSSHLDREGAEVRRTIDLRPNEGIVIEVVKQLPIDPQAP
jgi:alpha-glucosidase